ncbi:hypothetical protein [Streptomyces sp. NPDC023838]|uniref:hypothetical protein n=1 Tax=Streptomyces sp. NPDC023838 TaxID=3154325 RepID=UPI0033F5AD59
MPDSYADLSRFYDLVMTSGYYDYDAYAQALDYFIEDQGVVVAHQRLRFRLFPRETADQLLKRCGFHLQDSDGVLWQHSRR